MFHLHEYSSMQTPQDIIHQYILLDNQNPSGGENFVSLRNKIIFLK